MDYVRLGRSGLTVSVVGLGCNNLGRAGTATETAEGTAAVVDAALDAGITLFDTSDTYGAEPGRSETLLGRALRGRRDDAIVATKFGMDMRGANGTDFGARGSRRYIVKAAEASLRRLGTDYIDLYQMHAPDPRTPIEETLSALDDLVRSGKVRYLGHSNFAGWQIAEAAHVAEQGLTPFVSAQNHYSLVERGAEREVLPAAEHYELGVLPFFPLANGLLTGKYSSGSAPAGSRLSRSKQELLANERLMDRVRAYSAFARERGLAEVDVAFSWLASRPTVASVIAGATTPEQVRQNAAAASWVPTPEDETALDEIFPPATSSL